MAFKLKLPSFKQFRKTVADDASKAADIRLPLIGHLSIAQQLKILGSATVLCMLVAAIGAYINNREAGYSSRYVGESSKLLMLSQRLAKDTQLSLSGNSDSFDGLTQSKQDMSKVIELLDKGDASLPPTGGDARDALSTLTTSVNKTMQDVQAVENGRPGLVTLGSAITVIDNTSEEFRGLTQQMVSSYQGEQKVAATSLSLAVERIAKDAAKMLSSDVSLEQLAQLGVDTYAAEDALLALPSDDPNVQAATALFEPYRNSIEILVSQARNLVEAKAAANAILVDSDILLAKAQLLVSAYQTTLMSRISGTVALLAGGLTLLFLLLISKEYLEDSHRRAAEAERSNKQNQDAILRLMNELSDLAEGDLTIRATVTEDITGAIADSVNYTTEELRKLVGRITAAAEQMSSATKDAEDVSKGLLDAAQKQAREIEDAGESVQLMTKSIQEVDSSASQSAGVARRTLAATEEGAKAVRNTIAGMDGIREQIQETSKRIKRLGESSQEIGEIVDLISDITEQTNVLALNAAIQAASAGEAGRGFSVVAEEVQRLAERSAEATRQIGALVKTIQSDTHDAVAAMEKSTLGVVEGAKLSEVAGQSLKEIEQVSNELATLINSISVSTQVQTDMASEVATVMQDILKITGQTTEGTRLTANSVAQLTGLANDLKGSVEGFKV
ncbi:MAG: type IV pili methyl-accepting chemotaxis transducer N-terminal domain-containing protein [Nitrosomonadales bacterium]|nr:type IV pili methyl-accepting chemotaxis transducer N-terminal domain-containing protein [Nitrosomonadales bacterium]